MTVRRPDWLKAAAVEEICSASNCLSRGPDNWLAAWKHNEHWVFDTPELAAAMTGTSQVQFEIYAFQQYPIRLENGTIIEEPVKISRATPLPSDYEFLGYDAVSRSCDTNFECSPLSCNHAAGKMPVNSRCLFDTLDEAIAGAKAFSSGPWEPGPYYVVEVYRKKTGAISTGAGAAESVP